MPDAPEPIARPDGPRDGLSEYLDRELNRLPEKYRTPIILCDLEDMTHREAASQLGWPVGTVSTRLLKARAMLARRLSRHGVTLSVASLGISLAEGAASAAMPNRLIGTTARAASLIATGRALAVGMLSARIDSLAGGVLKMMFLSKLKVPTTIALVVLAATTGWFSFGPRTKADGTAPQPAPQSSTAPKRQGNDEALAKDQLKLARLAIEELETLRQQTRVDAADPRFAVWERRQIEALKASHASKTELISGLERYVNRMKEFAQVAEVRRQNAGIIHPDVLDWQYRVLEGEMWLNQEKAR